MVMNSRAHSPLGPFPFDLNLHVRSVAPDQLANPLPRQSHVGRDRVGRLASLVALMEHPTPLQGGNPAVVNGRGRVGSEQQPAVGEAGFDVAKRCPPPGS